MYGLWIFPAQIFVHELLPDPMIPTIRFVPFENSSLEYSCERQFVSVIAVIITESIK